MIFLHEGINDNSAESTLEKIIFQNIVPIYSVLLDPYGTKKIPVNFSTERNFRLSVMQKN